MRENLLCTNLLFTACCCCCVSVFGNRRNNSISRFSLIFHSSSCRITCGYGGVSVNILMVDIEHFCETMRQCGGVPNLVKLRDAICHNFILCQRILGTDPPKRETLHILATPTPPISPSSSLFLLLLPSPISFSSSSTDKSSSFSSCERWPSLS